MDKWLTFFEIDNPGKKTKRFIVKSKTTDTALAAIYWYGPWRKYIFQSTPLCPIFDTGCLKEITEFIDGLMAERKK